MTRGESVQTKIHYRGNQDDFVIFVDDVETYKKWQTDNSLPLAHFISSFQVFTTHKQGASGSLNAVSKAVLAAEFDTENEDEAIKIILEKGSSRNIEMPNRQGPKNDSKGTLRAK